MVEFRQVWTRCGGVLLQREWDGFDIATKPHAFFFVDVGQGMFSMNFERIQKEGLMKKEVEK